MRAPAELAPPCRKHNDPVDRTIVDAVSLTARTQAKARTQTQTVRTRTQTVKHRLGGGQRAREKTQRTPTPGQAGGGEAGQRQAGKPASRQTGKEAGRNHRPADQRGETKRNKKKKTEKVWGGVLTLF